MKDKLTILLAKLASGFLHLFGRHAGTVPGRLALDFNPDIFDYLKPTGKLIVITGTNGKTTTTNLLAETLRRAGKTVIANSHGNNINWGIATTLLKHANLSGRIKADFIVLETDEHWVPVLYAKKNLHPDTLIILDFFRDQLDRAGEMENIVQKLEKFVRYNPCTLILNGDDPNVVRIGRAHQKGANFYYGLAKLPTSYCTSTDKMEGIICPYCKAPLIYDYYQYSHLGHFHCPTYDFKNPPLATKITAIAGANFTVSTSISNRSTSISDHPISSPNPSLPPAKAPTSTTYATTNPNLYNLYNLLSIITFANLYHLDQSVVKHALATYKPQNGRYQTFHIKHKTVTLNLCKNPTGFNVVMRTIRHDGDPKDLLLVLNDHINDGFDVSWIWDIDFSDLTEFDKIVCAGTRAFDMAIPLKCNNFDPQKIIVRHDLDQAIHELLKGNRRKYIISNYSPLMQVQKILTKLEHQK